MPKQLKAIDNSDTFRNSLTTRLQQIIELLYKNNGHFLKGLPSEHQFQEMLSHCYNCYDQLDFIILEYSKHPVNYLEPKVIAEHMHRIMRVTKYLLSNARHWIESYSLDIAKKAWEDKSYFPAQASHQARCSSCNRYVQEIVLKEAKEEILGFQDMRETFEQEIREAKEQEQTQKPLTAKETTEYVGSVNYLTKIIKEMEESAHGYAKLTEVIEKEDSHQDMALRCLEDLLSSMRRRLGEKYIYRLKRVIKNWEKTENQDHQHMCKKPLFRIKQIINESYIPTLKSEVKKNAQATVSAGMIKKMKDENHQLQVENNTLNSAFNAAKNNLTFLQKREEIQKREMQRLKDLLEEKTIEKSSLAKELKISRRNIIDPQAELTITSPKSTANISAYGKQKMFGLQKKYKQYSKFKVQRMSRQSQALSNATDKTLDFTSGQNLVHYEAGNEDQDDSSQGQCGRAEVGCQWEDLYPSERGGKLKEKSSRNSKTVKSSNKQRVTIAKISKIEEQQELKRTQYQKSSKDKNRSLKALDPNIKSKANLISDNNRLSLQNQKVTFKESQTIKKLIEGPKQQISHLELDESKESTQNYKVSVKVLQNEPSVHKVSLEKINIYGNNTKVRELRPYALEKKVIILKDLPEASNQTRFTQEIKKILNYRMATEGNEVKSKVFRVRNTIFKPQHLSLFGGVSESYNYQKSPIQEEKLTEQDKTYFLELKNYLVNLRSFKNHLYDNIVMFLKCPFTLIDKDDMEIKIVGDKQLTTLVKKIIVFHRRKCQKITCEHLQSFNRLIGLPHSE